MIEWYGVEEEGREGKSEILSAGPRPSFALTAAT